MIHFRDEAICGRILCGAQRDDEACMAEHWKDVPRAEDAVRVLVQELDETRLGPDGKYVPPAKRSPGPAILVAETIVSDVCRDCLRRKAEALAWPEEPSRENAAGCLRIARGIADGAAFTSGQVKDAEALASVFLTLAVSGLPPPDFMEKVGAVWEWTDAAVATLGGRPAFLSARWLHVDDWQFVTREVMRIKGEGAAT